MQPHLGVAVDLPAMLEEGYAGVEHHHVANRQRRLVFLAALLLGVVLLGVAVVAAPRLLGLLGLHEPGLHGADRWWKRR